MEKTYYIGTKQEKKYTGILNYSASDSSSFSLNDNITEISLLANPYDYRVDYYPNVADCNETLATASFAYFDKDGTKNVLGPYAVNDCIYLSGINRNNIGTSTTRGPVIWVYGQPGRLSATGQVKWFDNPITVNVVAPAEGWYIIWEGDEYISLSEANWNQYSKKLDNVRFIAGSGNLKFRITYEWDTNTVNEYPTITGLNNTLKFLFPSGQWAGGQALSGELIVEPILSSFSSSRKYLVASYISYSDGQGHSDSTKFSYYIALTVDSAETTVGDGNHLYLEIYNRVNTFSDEITELINQGLRITKIEQYFGE